MEMKVKIKAEQGVVAAIRKRFTSLGLLKH
jgi:hypothetical protein